MATVADLMDRTLHSAPASTTVEAAAAMMAVAGVGSTLVVAGERLLGIFTERDVVRALSQSCDAARDRVDRWMTPNPVTISAAAESDHALRTMIERGFRHLPVVDGGGRLVGMLSLRDLARGSVESNIVRERSGLRPEATES